MKTGLFIGRFQPLHKGHIGVIKDAMKELDQLIIGVGSAEKHHVKDNPFTYEERRQMIENSIKGNYKIIPIPDLNNYEKWVDYVRTLVGDFDIVYTGNAVVEELFKQKKYAVKRIVEERCISAGDIRDMMANDANWQELVPKEEVEYLKKIDGIKRLKELNAKYKNPLPAVDIIIKYNGGIVLITRKDGKLAIPGGFIEYETAEQAAVREAKEETGLDIKIERLLGVYSDPERDPRHVMSVTYVAKGKGKLKAGDDARGAKVFKKIPDGLAFDHNKILNDYMKTEK